MSDYNIDEFIFGENNVIEIIDDDKEEIVKCIEDSKNINEFVEKIKDLDSEKYIGRGGNGVVLRLKCSYVESGEKVVLAIKIVLQRGERTSVSEIERYNELKREMNNTQVIQQFYVTQIDYKKIGNEFIWIAMKELKRFSVKTITSEEHLTKVCLKLIEGVEMLHGLGYCHRDIKMSNILEDSGNIILSDFGVLYHSSHYDEYTTVGETIGNKNIDDEMKSIVAKIENNVLLKLSVAKMLDVYMTTKTLMYICACFYDNEFINVKWYEASFYNKGFSKIFSKSVKYNSNYKIIMLCMLFQSFINRNLEDYLKENYRDQEKMILKSKTINISELHTKYNELNGLYNKSEIEAFDLTSPVFNRVLSEFLYVQNRYEYVLYISQEDTCSFDKFKISEDGRCYYLEILSNDRFNKIGQISKIRGCYSAERNMFMLVSIYIYDDRENIFDDSSMPAEATSEFVYYPCAQIELKYRSE